MKTLLTILMVVIVVLAFTLFTHINNDQQRSIRTVTTGLRTVEVVYKCNTTGEVIHNEKSTGEYKHNSTIEIIHKYNTTGETIHTHNTTEEIIHTYNTTGEIIHREDIIIYKDNNIKSWLLRDGILNLNKESCKWKTIKPPNARISYDMCLRTYKDIVSKMIDRDGKYDECDVLPSLLDETPETSIKGKLFVDIGANIGYCSLLMASVGAKVLSFEPQPSNLFYFQSSLERSNLYNSIELFPIGLGNEVGNFTMYAQIGNQGNSVIGKRLHDDEFNSALAKTMIPYNISVNTLDNVFARPELTGKVISVLKIDAQGFETNILKGSKSLLSSGRIRIIKLELSIKFLEGQGTSCQEVVDLLTGFGYSITLNGAKFDSSKCNILTRDRMEDIIARLH